MNTYQELRQRTPAPDALQIDWSGLLHCIPSLQLLQTTPQDAIYHAEGDVWTHTKMVCEAMVRSAEYSAANEDRRFVLFYACLLHDVAKPSCTVVESDGRITSGGHSKRGAIDARILLWKAGVPFELRERICSIVRWHQLPFYVILGDRSGVSPEFLVRKLSWETSIEDLAAVAEADIRGRICADQGGVLDNIALFRELAKEEGGFNAPIRFPDDHTKLMYFRSQGSIAHAYPFFQKTGSKVVVLSGLPACGKNTWVSKNASGLPVISFDDAREELGLKHGVNAGAAVHLAVDRAKSMLRDGTPFCWNATHLSVQMRQKTLDLLYAYNADVEIIYLESNESEIKSRNTKRDTTLTNSAIDKMLYRWEVPSPIEAHRVFYLT